MKNKKEILKKYVGKGGPTAPSPFKMIGNSIGNAVKNAKQAVTGGIVRAVGDTPAGKMLQDGLANQKRQTLKKIVEKVAAPKSMPLPKLSDSMPAFRPTKALGKASRKMQGVLQKEAPETLKTPSRTQFVSDASYNEANRKMKAYGNWASDK